MATNIARLPALLTKKVRAVVAVVVCNARHRRLGLPLVRCSLRKFQLPNGRAIFGNRVALKQQHLGVAPMSNPRLIVFALLSNFVLMPLCAVALSTMLQLDQALGVGILLLGCAAGAPFLPKLAELAKGNLPFAVGTMVLLMVVTVGYLPIVLPLLLPGVAVNPAKIAQSLVLLMLLPLGVGLALKSRYEELAARVKPVLDGISNVSLILQEPRVAHRV